MHKTIIKTLVSMIVIVLAFTAYAKELHTDAHQVLLYPITILHESDASYTSQLIYDIFQENAEIACAILNAESGGNIHAKNKNKDSVRSLDRGLFQINNYWHSEVDDDCAFNAECNIREAYRISRGGTDWHEWSTYTSGKYKKYLSIGCSFLR